MLSIIVRALSAPNATKIGFTPYLALGMYDSSPNEFAEDRRHALIFGFTFGEGVERIDVGKQ